MDPASIPSRQSQRVALYEQQFGTFDSGKNAYWSLRRGRPVTLAEGSRFDQEMRAGRLVPVASGGVRVVRGVSTMPSTTGAGTYRAVSARTAGMVRDLAPMPGGPPLRRYGWWKNERTGQTTRGRQGIPPTRTAGWVWSPLRDSAIAPQEKTSVMPTEARRVAALPSSPRPGPARPPSEPLFDAVMRQFQEQRAAPELRADFATPARPLAAGVTPSPTFAVAGFDMKKLALPLALVAGAFVVSKLV